MRAYLITAVLLYILGFSGFSHAATTTQKLEKGKGQVISVAVPEHLERSKESDLCSRMRTNRRKNRGRSRGRSRSRGGSSSVFTFSQSPNLKLTVERPLKKLQVTAIGGTSGLAVLVQTADADSPACYPSNFSLDLDPGEHSFWVGAAKGTAATAAMLIVREANTALNIADFNLPIPDGLQPEERVLQDFFPLLPVKMRWEWLPRHEKQQLFVKAAPKLVLYTTFDMDKDSASPYYWQTVSDYYRDILKQPLFPKANEPVVVTHRWGKKVYIMTADGLIFSTKLSYLKPTPKGKITMPKKMRHLIMELNDFEKMADADTKATIKKHKAQFEKAEVCWIDYMDNHGGSADLQLVTYFNGRVQRVQPYKDIVAKRAVARCGIKRLDARQRKIMNQMTSKYAADAQKAFTAIAGALESKK